MILDNQGFEKNIPRLNQKKVNLPYFKGMRFTFSTQDQLIKYKDAINYASGITQLLTDNPAFNPKEFADPKNVLVHANQCSDPRWKRALAVIDSNNLSTIQEAHIGKSNFYCKISPLLDIKH